MHRHSLTALFLATLFLWPVTPATAEDKEQAHQHLPVAFRTWPNQTVSLETYWGFTIAVGPGAAEVPGIDKPDQTLGGATLAVSFSKHEDATKQWDEQAHTGRLVVGLGEVRPTQITLDRKPNQAEPALLEQDDEPTPHAASVWYWRPTTDDLVLLESVAVVRADGVTIAYGGVLPLLLAAEDISELPGMEGGIDVVVLAFSDQAQWTAHGVGVVAERLHARMVYIFDQTDEDVDLITRKAVGNTTALIPGEEPAKDGPILIEHADEPWQMPEAMAALYDDLDATSRKHTPVFEELSVNQMNHKPANGTHTPRWNIEHMASRQMYFITAAYHAADNRFPHIQLDPKQMPPDYVARHPDWDGAEEARRVYRTTAFLRRFAYLYHGRDLDAPISERSRIRFAPIMKQVTRHWGLHTPNVQDKMKQDDWPAE